MLQKMSTKRWNTFGKIRARSRHKRKWVNKKQEEKNRKWRRQKNKKSPSIPYCTNLHS